MRVDEEILGVCLASDVIGKEKLPLGSKRGKDGQRAKRKGSKQDNTGIRLRALS